MSVEQLAAPDPEALVAQARAAFRDGAMLTVAARCEVEYEGRTSGYLGPGDRMLVAKPDGTFLVHQPTGHEPVNWMPGGGTVSARTSEGDAILLARRTNPTERVEARILDASGLTRFDATDGATYEESGTEAEMHEYIQNNPDALEEGLRIVEHERETKYGFVDFFARDADGTPVVVEVKRIQATLNHFDQLKRYVSLYEEGEAIPRKEGEAIPRKESESSGGEGSEAVPRKEGESSGGEGSEAVPRKEGESSGGEGSEAVPRKEGESSGGEGSEVRGMLVAPSASERVRRALRDAGLEFVALPEFDTDAKGTTEAKLTDF